MDNGAVASLHDNSAHGEDAFLMRKLSDTASLDVVLDGLTHCEGAYASGFTVQLLQEAPIESLNDLTDAIEVANDTLFRSGRGRNLLTTISVGLKTGDQLHVINSGDSPVYLIRGNEVRELTNIVKSCVFPSVVSEAVGLQGKFIYQYKKLTIQPHDRLILATDGLIDNIFPEEIMDIVRQVTTPQEAVAALQELVNEKRRLHKGRQDSYGTFREDDLTCIIRYFD